MAEGEDAAVKSFLLIDEQEEIVVEDSDAFCFHSGCSNDTRLKVVSIFGNTGDGKSHTLNQVFFNGQQVFRTSPEQHSCTVGVWAAYSPHHRTLVLDTEGLLGSSDNENKRLRLLLKTLAVSDIVIYRTRAERLHNDMFLFLDNASNAYWKYFSPELAAVCERNSLPLSSLGPVIMIFHETQFTDTLVSLDEDDSISPEEIIQKRFSEMKLSISSFSALEYVGTRTLSPPTDFIPLKKRIFELLKNDSVRSPRTAPVILASLLALNENFLNDISDIRPDLFPDYYFSCQETCTACGKKCELSTNHSKHGLTHSLASKCKYVHKHDNRIMLCKKCREQGIVQEVEEKSWSEKDSSWLGIAKYAWSGYIIECPNCGIIYQSRQHWYGNSVPEHGSIIMENKHLWSSSASANEGATVAGSSNRYREAIDMLRTVSDNVSSITGSSTERIADTVAPQYWIPNADIKCCCVCETDLAGGLKKKHHCRACGNGVCTKCSTHSIPVPWRGWGERTPVRVCDTCYHSNRDGAEREGRGEGSVSSRYISENLSSAVGWFSNVIDYPMKAVVESVRPSYWTPDHLIIQCSVCQYKFTSDDVKHHCRTCGNGVCSDCSLNRKPVPSHGWNYPVRVCDKCMQ